MSEYRKKLEGFEWPSTLPDNIRYLARWRSLVEGMCGIWMGHEVHPEYCHLGYWRAPSVDAKDEDGVYIAGDTLPVGYTPLLLCRDDYVTNAEATTLDATVMEKALREISRIANAKLSPLEQDAALEIIASTCYEVLGE